MLRAMQILAQKRKHNDAGLCQDARPDANTDTAYLPCRACVVGGTSCTKGVTSMGCSCCRGESGMPGASCCCGGPGTAAATHAGEAGVGVSCCEGPAPPAICGGGICCAMAVRGSPPPGTADMGG
jgi:hypothetical protein